MRRFVEPKRVETQVFDWGRIQWLSEPHVTGTERITAGVMTLEPGWGHQRHNHPGVEEILYVIEGEGIQMVELGKEERRTVRAGTMIHIPGRCRTCPYLNNVVEQDHRRAGTNILNLQIER